MSPESRELQCGVDFVMWAVVFPPNVHRKRVVLMGLDNVLRLSSHDLMTR